MRGRIPTLPCVALAAIVALAGCDGRNPLLKKTQPDPTPIPVATPTPDPAFLPDSRYFPMDKSTHKWLDLSETGAKPLSQAIVSSTFMVLVEAEQLTDPTLIKALITASKQPNSVAQGSNVGVSVILDDSGDNAALNKPAVDTLQAAGVGAFLVHHMQNPVPFKRLKSNMILVATGATYDGSGGSYTGAMYVLNGPLTPESLAKAGSMAVLSADSKDITEGFKALIGAFNPTQNPFTSTNPNILAAPLAARQELRGLINGAQTSLDLATETLTDPELVGLIAQKAKNGVAVRIVLPSDKTAERDSLKAAGIDQVKLAPDVSGILGVLDGGRMLQGTFSLSAQGIDEDHSLGYNLTQAPLVSGAKAAFEAKWAATQ